MLWIKPLLHCLDLLTILKGRASVGSGKAWNLQKTKIWRVKAGSVRAGCILKYYPKAAFFFFLCFITIVLRSLMDWNTIGCNVLKPVLAAGQPISTRLPASQVPDKLMSQEQLLLLMFLKAEIWNGVWMLRASSAVHKNVNWGDFQVPLIFAGQLTFLIVSLVWVWVSGSVRGSTALHTFKCNCSQPCWRLPAPWS